MAPDEGRFSYAVAAPATDRYTHGFARQVADITVAKLDPKIRLRPSQRTIDYGRTVGVEVRVPSDAANQVVRVYESKPGGARRLLHDGPVGPDGTIVFTRAPRVNTRYSVEYDGDARYRASTVKITVGVRAIVATRLLRAAGSSGRYKLYRASQPVFILAAVAPDHTGKPVTIDVERSNGGRWRPLASDDFRLRKGSAVVVFIPGGALRSGMQLRTRSIFDDADHALGRSRYAYFRVINGRIVGYCRTDTLRLFSTQRRLGLRTAGKGRAFSRRCSLAHRSSHRGGPLHSRAMSTSSELRCRGHVGAPSRSPSR